MTCAMCERPFIDDEVIRLVEGKLVCADCYADLPGPETASHPFGYGEFDSPSGAEREMQHRFTCGRDPKSWFQRFIEWVIR